MQKKNFKSASWDIYDSTYIQVIYLQNGKEFTGYSKRTGFAEKNDKQALLINWIIRMHKAGYLDESWPDTRRKVYNIEYYINHHPIKKIILSLYYKYYECLDSKWGMSNIRVIEFLDTFYNILNSGDPQKIKSLYVHKKTRYNDPFDLSQRRFITQKSLHEYCHRMMENNTFTQEQSLSFYKNYIEKYPFKNH